LPGKVGDAGRTAADNLLFVNAVLFILKTGIPWADLPERFGKSNSVWQRFDRWAANGVWERIFKTLGQNSLIEEMKELHLDSTTVKAHQVASTGRRDSSEKKRRLTTEGVSGVPTAD
jgi:putative transposase